MSDSSKLDMLYDMVKDLRDDHKESKEEIALIKANLMTMSFTLQKNTDSLDEHIEGVNTLRMLHEQNAERIERLEEPKKVKELIVKKVMWYSALITSVAGATAAIMKFFNQA